MDPSAALFLSAVALASGVGIGHRFGRAAKVRFYEAAISARDLIIEDQRAEVRTKDEAITSRSAIVDRLQLENGVFWEHLRDRDAIILDQSRQNELLEAQLAAAQGCIVEMDSRRDEDTAEYVPDAEMPGPIG